MAGEFAFIDALRAIATDPAARNLTDDAAVLSIGGETLVVTLDTIVEGVHYRMGDAPEDIAWKLVAVNVSDLAAKGARPLGCLYSHALGDAAWDERFLAGIARASAHFAIPLLGGDTVRMPDGSARSFSLTAFGTGAGRAPDRSGARPGDDVWVCGTVGDAGLGLSISANDEVSRFVQDRYLRPDPDWMLGRELAQYASAMMDVSDGLLVDAGRMAEASGVAISLAVDDVPLSAALIAIAGDSEASRLAAMTAGDDYELLFTAPADTAQAIRAAAGARGRQVTCIGAVRGGAGLSLTMQGSAIPLPASLGYQH